MLSGSSCPAGAQVSGPLTWASWDSDSYKDPSPELAHLCTGIAHALATHRSQDVHSGCCAGMWGHTVTEGLEGLKSTLAQATFHKTRLVQAPPNLWVRKKGLVCAPDACT